MVATLQQINEESRPRHKTLPLVRRLLGYITGYWQTKAALAFIVAAIALDVLTPRLIGETVDTIRNVAVTGKISAGEGVETAVYQFFAPIAGWAADAFHAEFSFAFLGVLCISLVVITSLTGVLNYFQRYALAYVAQKGSYEMRNDIYNSLLDQSFSFYDHQRTGQLMSRATADVDEVQRFFGFELTQVISTSLLFTLVFYSLFSIDWQLTFLSILFIPLILLTTLRLASKVGPIWVKIRNQLGIITSVAQENLMAVRVVRGFARESYEEEKFETECETYFKFNVEGTKIRAFYNPLATLIASLGVVVIIWYGGSQVISGALSIGSLVAFYLYIARLMQPVRMVGFIAARLQRAVASAERIFDVIDAKSVVSDREEAMTLRDVEGHVVLEDVWFGYDERNMVLKRINLDVNPGETVAILGATGSGKSSIISLIPRFYDVTRGRITIDGRDVRDVTLSSLRQHIGIVRQDPFIFSTTLRENIAYGVEDAKQEDIEEAAKKAKIHDFISSLPEGYETRVGERGVTLSGGQKQRIAIARALLKEPKILILDDSTSSVDTQTEFEIQQTLAELFKNRTTFVITQRLSSVRNASYIVVLEKGEIAEEGTHGELMARKGIYYKLYETQAARGGESGEEGL